MLNLASLNIEKGIIIRVKNGIIVDIDNDSEIPLRIVKIIKK